MQNIYFRNIAQIDNSHDVIVVVNERMTETWLASQ